MLHLQVAKAKGRLPPAGLGFKGLAFFLFFSRESALKTQLINIAAEPSPQGL
jgi:hypothetical protein